MKDNPERLMTDSSSAENTRPRGITRGARYYGGNCLPIISSAYGFSHFFFDNYPVLYLIGQAHHLAAAIQLFKPFKHNPSSSMRVTPFVKCMFCLKDEIFL